MLHLLLLRRGVRFRPLQQGSIRQAGRVSQRYVSVDLINGKRHASGTITLTGQAEEDKSRATALLKRLREWLPHLPEDPHLLYATEVHSAENVKPNRLPSADDAMGSILAAGHGRDFVGI